MGGDSARDPRAPAQREGAAGTESEQLPRPTIDETLTLIRFRLGLAASNAWWEQIDGSARLRWERVENDRFERARHLFFQYRDKDLSFADCTSVAIMRELKLTTVITTDGHFRQIGFDVLPATRRRRTRKPRRS